MPNWMVVEDEPDVYDVLMAMLEIWEVDGTAFTDLADSIAWIKMVDSGKYKGTLPELALLDIRLPDGSGVDVAKKLRASRKLKNIGIVMLTAYRMHPRDERIVMKKSKADRLVYKPLPPVRDFRKLLNGILESRRK